MEYAIIAAIIMITGSWVLYPLLRRSQSRASSGFQARDDRKEVLQQNKENLYAAIKEMDFDYQMGKLSEDDYQRLKTQYKGKAVEILKSLDNANQEEDAGLEAMIESEVRQLRKEERTEIAEAKDDAPRQPVNLCSQCGEEMSPRSKFCQHCGVKLTASHREEPA